MSIIILFLLCLLVSISVHAQYNQIELIEYPNTLKNKVAPLVHNVNEVIFFWPLDLKIEVIFDHSTFEEEKECLSVYTARRNVSRNSNNPHAYHELVRAIENENLIESCKEYNQKIAELYEAKHKKDKLTGKEYVEWALAVSRLGKFDEKIKILEIGIDKVLTNEDKLIISRSLGGEYILAASRSLMPAGFMKMMESENKEEFFGKFENIAKNYNEEFTIEQKEKARNYINKSEDLLSSSLKNPRAKSIDYFNFAWFKMMSRMLLDAIEKKSSDPDTINLFRSPYIEKAFDKGKGDKKIEAARSLKNIMVAVIDFEKKGSPEELLKILNGEKAKLEKMTRSRYAVPAEVYDALAVVYFYLGEDISKIQKMCTTALTKNPAMKNAFVIRMLYLTQNKNWQESIKIADKKVKKDHLAISYSIAACCYAYNNDFKKAGELASDGIFEARDSTNQTEDRTILSIILATAKMKLGKFDEGFESLLNLYRNKERHQVLIYNLAAGFYLIGDYKTSNLLLSELNTVKSDKIYTEQMRDEANKLKTKVFKKLR